MQRGVTRKTKEKKIREKEGGRNDGEKVGRETQSKKEKGNVGGKSEWSTAWNRRNLGSVRGIACDFNRAGL